MSLQKQAILDIKTRGIPRSEKQARTLFGALTGNIKAIEKLDKSMERTGRTFERQGNRAVRATLRTNKALRKQGDLMGRVVKLAGALRIGQAAIGQIKGAFAAFGGLREVLKLAGQEDIIDRTFQKLAGGASRAAGFLDQLRVATNATISDTDLQTTSNAFLATGLDITSQRLGKLINNLRIFAQTQGITAVEASDGFAKSILRVSERGLKALGVTVDFQKALSELSKASGVSTTEIDKQTQRVLLLEVAERQLAEQVVKLTDVQSPAFERAQQINAAFDNMASKIRAILISSPEFQQAMSSIATIIVQVGSALAPVLVQLAKLAELITSVPGLTGFLAGAGTGATAGAGIGFLFGGPAGAGVGAGIGALAGGLTGAGLELFGRAQGESFGLDQGKKVGQEIRGSIRTGVAEGLDNISKEITGAVVRPTFEGGF